MGGGGQAAQQQLMMSQALQAERAQREASNQVKAQEEANALRKEEIDLQQGARLARAEIAPDDAQADARRSAVARAKRSFAGANQTLLTGGSLGGYFAPGVQKTLIGE